MLLDRTSATRAFGLHLRELRLRAGLTEEALAHKSGLHRTYIRTPKRGQRNVS